MELVVTWLAPTIAIEVSYGRLQQGWLREPACRGLADDIGSAWRSRSDFRRARTELKE